MKDETRGSYMGYRLYLAKMAKTNDLEKSKQISYSIEKSKDDDGFFEHYTFVEKMGFNILFELDDDDDFNTLRKEKRSYFPPKIIKKYGDNFLHQVDDCDGTKIVEVKKEDIWEIIRVYHTKKMKEYKEKYEDTMCEHYEYKHHVADKLHTWTTSYDCLAFDKDGNLAIPYIVSTSWEFRIFQMVNIHNDVNWEEETVILYGW